MNARIIGNLLVGRNGFKLAEEWAEAILFAREYKVAKLEAVARSSGICLTIYGRPLKRTQPEVLKAFSLKSWLKAWHHLKARLTKQEKLKLWHLKIFRLTEAHLITTELDPEQDERDKFFKKHNVRPEHIASAALDNDIVTFCLYWDSPRQD